MKIIILLIGILSFSFGQASDMPNLISMNVYMLPKPIHWSMQNERTNAIANQLASSNFDVVFMQEAFIASFRTSIAEKLKTQFPYSHYLDRDGSWSHLFGSGLFILSRYPIQVLNSMYFADCGGFDCFASKGALIFQLVLPDGKSFQFATTHLQAGPEFGSIRLKQIEAIKAGLNKVKSEGVPQLLVGDLNIDFSDPEFITGLAIMQMNYSPLSGLLRTTSARSNDCYSTPTKKMWIDHVWFDKSSEGAHPEIEVADFSFDYENKKCPSSDHHAVVLKQLSKVVYK